MNENILIHLNLLAEKEKFNHFKYKAYKNAIEIIKNMEEIKDISQIQNIKGIGKGIIQRVEEILENGTLKELPIISPEQEVLKIFTNIYGVGEKKAKELYQQNVTDLITLKERQNELLNEKQKIGLKYYYHLLKRIPNQEMQLHEKFIKNIWDNDITCKNKNFTFEIVGSYRRKEPTSGDIDILITFNIFENILPKLILSLKRHNYIIESLAEGPKKFMGICKLPHLTPRRIDIIWTEPEEYPFALLYFTGSDRYNRNMREHANRKGYKLNEKGLEPLNPNLIIPKFKFEKEIVEFLELPFLQPEFRKGNLFNPE